MLTRLPFLVFSIGAILAALGWPIDGFAERLLFRSYGIAEGLTSLGGTCFSQVGPGYILVCSEHGLFSYDGRTFQNLGPPQGLADGGVVYDVATTAGGLVAVRFPDRVFLSDAPVTLDRPPTSLRFRPVDLHGAKLFNEHVKQIARTGHDLALIVGSRTMRIVHSSSATPDLQPMNYSPDEQAALEGSAGLFSAQDRLWETFKDGRICSADPGSVRCIGPAQGLTGGPWEDVVSGRDGDVIARSAGTIAIIDSQPAIVRIETLPDQGGLYKNYTGILGLFRTSNGDLVTQSADGLIIRKPSGWQRLDTKDGVPSGMISSVLGDWRGQLWVQVTGRSLYRGLGYGYWISMQHGDGLSEGSAWQSVRTADGSIWVSTDTGVDQVRRVGEALRVVRTIPVAGYALALGPGGRVWSGDGKDGVLVVDPVTGAIERFATPPVDAISAGDGTRMWLGTEHGLFHVDEHPGTPLVAVSDGRFDGVAAVSPDASGGAWFLAEGRLWHRLKGGGCERVSGVWPSSEFEPFAMAVAPGGHVWLGGAGGLYDLIVAGNRVVRLTGVPQSDLRTTPVMAGTIDRRGWVGAGTGRGIAVFNGERWVAADADLGLVGDDVGQGGLYADPDGSIWIATGQGVSHLLDPEWLASRRPVSVAISQAALGETVLPAGTLPYTTAPLVAQFGTFSFASERSITFRYRLSGVDAGWAESASGTVRYASVPPGRHALTVIGYDALSRTASKPVSLVIDMGWPWWDRWWAELAFALAAAGALHALIRLRERAASNTRRALERLVEERTREMRAAQAELRRQATLDGLTGLLNRTELQKQLGERLASGQSTRELMVAMVDIDHFKTINDRHGHLTGDDVICAMAVRVASLLRDGECAGRYGGEEFIIVLDDEDGRGAERILVFHQMVRQGPFHMEDASIAVTCSIGLAWSGPGDDWKSLIGRADAALYKAKASGRDRVIESEDDQLLPGSPDSGTAR